MLDLLLALVVDADALRQWIDENEFAIEEPVPPNPNITPPAQASGYQLTFNDEFTDLSISNSFTYDGKRWYTETEPCCMPGGTTTYRVYPHVVPPTTVEQANPFSIVDGDKLRIRLKTVNGTWYGGGLATTDRDNQLGFAQQYGYWEARMKWSPGPSSGPWLSFWGKTQKRTGPPGPNGMYTQVGEIDILEFWGDAPAMWSTLHDWVANTHQQACKAKAHFDFYSDYHTYGMMWDASKMSFWFDNVKQCEVNTFSQGHLPYYVILDLGMGGGYPVNQTPNPTDMYVDWVRIWKKPASLMAVPEPIAEPAAVEEMTRPSLDQRKDWRE